MITKINNKTYTIKGNQDYLNHIANEFEPNTVLIFKSLVEPSYIAVDIGANIGCTAIALGTLCSRVLGFEPNPETFAYLKENLADSHLTNVECYNLGISDKQHDTVIQHHGGLSGAFISETVPGFVGVSEDIHMVSLDEFCKSKKIEKVDFIKIDVEGYELTALAGCKEILSTNQPICLLEMNHWCLNAFQRISLPDFIDRLKEIFPFLYAIDDGKSANLLSDAHIYSVLYQNICQFKWMDVVGCFNEQQVAKVLDNFPPFDERKLPMGERLYFNDIKNSKYLISGWSVTEAWGTWSDGNCSTILFQTLPEDHNNIELDIEGEGFVFGDHQELHMNVIVNDQYIETVIYGKKGVVNNKIKISKEIAFSNNGEVHVQLQFINPKSPLDLNLSNDSRQLGLGLRSIKLRIDELVLLEKRA